MSRGGILTLRKTLMGCRPQMVFPYFLKYSVNALGSPCKQTALNQLGFVRPSDFLGSSQSSDCSTVLEKYLLNDVHALCVQPLYSFVDGPLQSCNGASLHDCCQQDNCCGHERCSCHGSRWRQADCKKHSRKKLPLSGH